MSKHLLIIFLGVFLFSYLLAQDDEHQIRGSGELGAGFGLGRAKFSAGSHANRELGITFHLHIGSRGFHFSVDIDPYQLQHPVRREEFTATTFLFAFKLFHYKQAYVQPGFGFQYRKWSGVNREKDTNFGFAYRIGVGYRYPVSPKFSLHPELFYRTSEISSDSDKSASFIGIQLTTAWDF